MAPRHPKLRLRVGGVGMLQRGPSHHRQPSFGQSSAQSWVGQLCSLLALCPQASSGQQRMTQFCWPAEGSWIGQLNGWGLDVWWGSSGP